MQYFTKDFSKFFNGLAKNNKKEWFHEHKKEYETAVKEPFACFIQDLIHAIAEHDEDIAMMEAKDCIFRVNRDIRFSKDKTPYKTHMTAFVSSGGKKDKTIPGIYLRFSPKMIGIMGGIYHVEKNALYNLRKTLAKDAKPLKKLLEAKEFKKRFGQLQGEKNKRVQKDLAEAAEKEPLILNKQFYFWTERESELLLSKKLIQEIMAYWHAARPLNEYLYNIVKQS